MAEVSHFWASVVFLTQDTKRPAVSSPYSIRNPEGRGAEERACAVGEGACHSLTQAVLRQCLLVPVDFGETWSAYL